MHSRNGQSALEYAVIIACVVAALVAMQIYIKRGVQGRLRQAADEVGQAYEPKNTTSDITTTYSGKTTTEVKTTKDKGVYETNTTTTIDAENPETEERSGYETVGAM